MKAEHQHIHGHLISKCQNGDQSAFAELYKLYAKAMYNICRRMMGDEEEAKDILQESFVDAYKKLPTLRDVNTFSLWLKRIVTNNCINAIRKRKIFTDELSEEHDMFDEDDGDFYYDKYRMVQVMAAVDKLPDGCKTVLNLYLFEGYDHKEIAGILNVSESASKAQYCKAKAKVRNYLNLNSATYV